MYISIPSILVLMFFSNQILGMLFPNAKDGGELLSISAISIFFITIEQIANNILHAIGKTKVPVVSIILGTITKAILNYILAGMTSYIYLIKKTKLKILKRNFVKPIFASTILIIVAKLIYSVIKFKTSIKLVVSLGIGVLVYVAIVKSMESLAKISHKSPKYWKNSKKKKDFVF